MILQSLVRYYEDLLQQNDKKPTDERIPKLGWCLARVSYMIELKEGWNGKADYLIKDRSIKTTDSVRARNVFKKWKMSTCIFFM